MTNADFYATSIHEAGHAVIGRVLGLTCGAATIVPDERLDEAGSHEVAGPDRIMWDWELRGKIRDPSFAYRGRILSYMAGAEAERELLGKCHGGDGDDREQIELMAASRYAFDDDAKWLRAEPRMRRATASLVRRHRLKIERVAAALRDRKTLSDDEIQALLIPR